MLNRDDEPLPYRDINQVRAKRASRQRAQFAHEVVADLRPSVVVARDWAVARQMPHNIFRKAAFCGGEVAATLTTKLGRPISYHPETVEEAYASRSSYGAADWEVDGWVSTYTAIANGELAGVTEDIPHLTGHPATSLAELLSRDNPT